MDLNKPVARNTSDRIQVQLDWHRGKMKEHIEKANQFAKQVADLERQLADAIATEKLGEKK